MKTLTDYPERLADIETLYVGPDYAPHKVARIRTHREGVIVQFDKIHDRDAAEALREFFIYIHLDDAVPLEDGEYYLFQLEGIRVVSDEGEELGTFTGVIETGANDVYIITTPDDGELLLPAIPEVIQDIDITEGVMTVHLLEGLR